MLLDTHAWAWTLTSDVRLSLRAVGAINNADHVYLSPISFFEIGQKLRLGKWDEMIPYANDLVHIFENQGGKIADLDAEICLSASRMDWIHRDPFDRLICATAIKLNLPLISCDTIFDSIATRVW